ncbi:MAG TPA: Flp family type IVb pilin [bacterium]|nr:Flp family type IVb pilin [bacterium]
MKLLAKKKGQGMTEYILIIALIAIVVIAGVRLFGGKVNEGFRDAAEQIEQNTTRR